MNRCDYTHLYTKNSFPGNNFCLKLCKFEGKGVRRLVLVLLFVIILLYLGFYLDLFNIFVIY